MDPVLRYSAQNTVNDGPRPLCMKQLPAMWPVDLSQDNKGKAIAKYSGAVAAAVTSCCLSAFILQNSDTKQLLRGFSATVSSLPTAALRGRGCWMLLTPLRLGKSFLYSSRQQNFSLNSQTAKGLFSNHFHDQASCVTAECFPRDILLSRIRVLSNICLIRT